MLPQKRNINSHTAAIAVLVCAYATMSAQDAVTGDSIALIDRIVTSRTENMTRPAEAFGGNPASMAAFRSVSLSDLTVIGDYNTQSEAKVVQEGRGHLLGSISASSYMHLSGTTTVWGDASFTTGQRRDILWNNAADYMLVAPYVYGDSVGGDLSTRRYSFSGGYAGTSGEWGWGAKASYTAAIDYRNRDPRDKIVVSDLDVELGVTRSIGESHAAGAGGSLRIYNQESDVEFYNPNNEIRAYAITGLGNYYPRFSGTSDLNTAYKGTGATATIQLFPAKGCGAYVNARFGYTRIGQVLRDFNNLELSRTKTYTTTLFAAYTFHAGNMLLAPTLEGAFQRRLGFENMFGSSVGNNYIPLGARRNYYADNVCGRLSIGMLIPASSTVEIVLKPAVGACYRHEDYRSPNRALESLAFIPGVSAAVNCRINSRSLLEVSASGWRKFAESLREKLPGLNTSSGIGNTVVHNYAMLTSDSTDAGVSAGYCRSLDSAIALSVSASYRHEWIGNAACSDIATVAIGLKF